jgi:hypothetical protein
MILKRKGEARGAVFYEGDDGHKYQLRQVNRAYIGRSKPPVYYLERLEGKKAVYLSGLFETGKQGLYSLDMRDKVTGVKVLYDAVFMQGGETVEIKRKGKVGVAV